MRARMALWVSRTPVVLREVVLADKPPDLLAASAKGTVPVLVLPDGRVIDESYDIMKWALTRCDPEGWLGVDLTAADALIDRNDNEFKPNLDRYKYPQLFPEQSDRQSDSESGRDAGLAYLHTLDSLCAGRPFLFGDRISIVDVAVAPFVRQFAQVDAEWFESSAGQSISAWLAGFTASTLFQSVMRKYARWSPQDRVTVFAREMSP